ncbi:hypothetical protein [Nevskia sp.]|nr:hypothetical protein [Nevskia sp.]
MTAPAEIVGCYFVLIWVKRDAPLLALAGSTQSRSTPRRSLER